LKARKVGMHSASYNVVRTHTTIPKVGMHAVSYNDIEIHTTMLSLNHVV